MSFDFGAEDRIAQKKSTIDKSSRANASNRALARDDFEGRRLKSKESR
jgi:hypothetical protein